MFRKLFRVHRLTFAILLFLFFWFEACITTRGAIGKPGFFGDKWMFSFNQGTKIESIWSHPLEVLVTVRVNPKNVPYIRAERVIVVPTKLSEEGMASVTKRDAGKTIEVAVNDVFQIELLGTPTTGFWWYFEALDEEYVELVKEYTTESFSEGIEGGPLMGIWLLRAKKAGMTTIKMAYYRSWEGGGKHQDQFWIKLKIISKTKLKKGD
ncbi:MAG: protease inhibitor I42 family protein [Proteobacteria bacterium]|nr:protease inhibitor I42 family protein [Pseudomonadota bacterium]